MSSAFHYRDGVLLADAVDLNQLADQIGTPCYVYSVTALSARFAEFTAAVGSQALVCFAVKANSNQAVLKALGQAGTGADVVSSGEMQRALTAGIPGNKIVFSGVGKSGPEIDAALAAGIYQFNVESVPEIEMIAARAQALGKRAPVAFRINPDIAAPTHAKIATGGRDNKFGIPALEVPALYQWASRLPGIDLKGLALHIGSQILDLAPLRAAFISLHDLARQLRADSLPVSRLDLGGGLGITYQEEQPPSFAAYAEMVRQVFSDFTGKLIFEPGRCIAGPAGILLARVLYVKQSHHRTFLVLDAGMNDLLRPAMYDSFHPIIPVIKPAHGAPVSLVDIVGPICESSDIFAKDRPMPPLQPGAVVAFAGAGAYGAVMGSSYNTRPLAAEIMVSGDKYAIIRPRLAVEALIAQDRLPDWL